MQYSAVWPVLWQCVQVVLSFPSRSCRLWMEIRALGPSPWTALCFIKSCFCRIRCMMVFAEKPGLSAIAWTCSCMCSSSPPRALMRMIVLNLGQSRSPMLEIRVIRSSILSIVSFKGVVEVKRISSACLISISWVKVPRFSWRSRNNFQTTLAVGRC